jgi:hypothetical protein
MIVTMLKMVAKVTISRKIKTWGYHCYHGEYGYGLTNRHDEHMLRLEHALCAKNA